MHANAPADLIEQMTEKANAADLECCEVWRENWASVQFFFSICSQWLFTNTGDYLGLDRKAIESTMNMKCIAKYRRKKLLADVEVMEQAALEII